MKRPAHPSPAKGVRPRPSPPSPRPPSKPINSDNSADSPPVEGPTELSAANVTNVRRVRSSGWSARDWRDYFGERAAIAEYDGRLPRIEAERLARLYCRLEWSNRNSPPDPGAGRCVHCRELLGDAVTTISTTAGARHLHSACADEYAAERSRAACEALAKIGLMFPSEA